METRTKNILIGAGVFVGVLALAVTGTYLIKKAKGRKDVADPALPKGTDADVSTNYGQVVGSTVYPKDSYAMVRWSAQVNDPRGLFTDFNQHNQLWKITSPNPVGTVLQELTGKEDGKIWYKIKPLSKPSGNFHNAGYSTNSNNINVAYVRSDVVTFKKP